MLFIITATLRHGDHLMIYGSASANFGTNISLNMSKHLQGIKPAHYYWA